MNKPFSQACENNKQAIYATLKPYLAHKKSVLEIASGTGQHAVYLGQQMPHLQWQTSDLIDKHQGILQWISDAGLTNVLPPLTWNVTTPPPVEQPVDAVFMANTLHIMSQSTVQQCIAQLPKLVVVGGLLCIYGPFNYKGQYTSESNAAFDQWLQARDHASGIRDVEWVNQQLEDAGFTIEQDHPMPANNRLLVYLFKG
ncbi:MAG: DUF938 domain-containing protein [Pseudomonadota bacterium]